MTSEWKTANDIPIKGRWIIYYYGGRPHLRLYDEFCGQGYRDDCWMYVADPPKPTPERRPYDPAVDGAPGWSKQVPSLGTADTPEELAEQRDIYAWHLASIPGNAMVITPAGSVKSEDRGTEKVAEMKAAWEARQ